MDYFSRTNFYKKRKINQNTFTIQFSMAFANMNELNISQQNISIKFAGSLFSFKIVTIIQFNKFKINISTGTNNNCWI